MAGDSLTVTETGLQGVETAMQAVSDNLANAQTTGFQSESVDFATLLGEFVAGNALGGGVSYHRHHARPFAGRDHPDQLADRHGDSGRWLLRAAGFRGQLRPSPATDITQVSANGTLVGFNGDAADGLSRSMPRASPPACSGRSRFRRECWRRPPRPKPPASAEISTPTSPVIAGAINPANPDHLQHLGERAGYDSLGNSHVLTYYYQNAGPGVAPVGGELELDRDAGWQRGRTSQQLRHCGLRY